MKTPDEIKKGLERCSCDEFEIDCFSCPYMHDPDCWGQVGIDALEYIQQLENHIGEFTEKVSQIEAAQPKWISVKEPPKEDTDKEHMPIDYLVYAPKYGVNVGNYVQSVNRWVYRGRPADVTHWMPMPEPPEEGTDEKFKKE